MVRAFESRNRFPKRQLVETPLAYHTDMWWVVGVVAGERADESLPLSAVAGSNLGRHQFFAVNGYGAYLGLTPLPIITQNGVVATTHFSFPCGRSSRGFRSFIGARYRKATSRSLAASLDEV